MKAIAMAVEKTDTTQAQIVIIEDNITHAIHETVGQTLEHEIMHILSSWTSHKQHSKQILSQLTSLPATDDYQTQKAQILAATTDPTAKANLQQFFTQLETPSWQDVDKKLSSEERTELNKRYTEFKKSKEPLTLTLKDNQDRKPFLHWLKTENRNETQQALITLKKLRANLSPSHSRAGGNPIEQATSAASPTQTDDLPDNFLINRKEEAFVHLMLALNHPETKQAIQATQLGKTLIAQHNAVLYQTEHPQIAQIKSQTLTKKPEFPPLPTKPDNRLPIVYQTESGDLVLIGPIKDKPIEIIKQGNQYKTKRGRELVWKKTANIGVLKGQNLPERILTLSGALTGGKDPQPQRQIETPDTPQPFTFRQEIIKKLKGKQSRRRNHIELTREEDQTASDSQSPTQRRLLTGQNTVVAQKANQDQLQKRKEKAKETISKSHEFSEAIKERLDSLVEHAVEHMEDADYSLGAAGPEAWKNAKQGAVNMGVETGTGEGGIPQGFEAADKLRPQVASGRFGVGTEYLVGRGAPTNAKDAMLQYLENAQKNGQSVTNICVKLGQGAKPGKGGELPGFKITPEVAHTRKVAPDGLTQQELEEYPFPDIYSSGNPEDLYSIEDLTLLFHSFKVLMPGIKVTVKLVSDLGVGLNAVASVKTGADKIIIAGSEGGTGAAPYTSQQHTGLPGVVGIALAHQALMTYRLRDQIEIVGSGAITNGADIVLYHALGANKVELGTASLVAQGCNYLKKCHEARKLTLTEVEDALRVENPISPKTPQELINAAIIMGDTDITGNVSPNFDPTKEDALEKFQTKYQHILTEENAKTLYTALRNAKGGCDPYGVATADPLNRSKFKGTVASAENFYLLLALQVDDQLQKLGLDSLDQIVGRAEQYLQISEQSPWQDAHKLFEDPSLRFQLDKIVYTPLKIPSDPDVEVLEKLNTWLNKEGRKPTDTFKTEVTLTDKDISFGAPISAFLQLSQINNPVKITVRGVGAQNLGVWSRHNLQINVEGAANDHTAKGAQGKIVVKGPAGNQVGYGMSYTEHEGGEIKPAKLYIDGTVGVKAGIRNSGGHIVVNGDTHAKFAYFMSKGIGVVTGEIGEGAFIAMTGGKVYFNTADGKNKNLMQKHRTRKLTEEEIQQLKAIRDDFKLETGKKIITEQEIENYRVYDPTTLNIVTGRLAKDSDLTEHDLEIKTSDHQVGHQIARNIEGNGSDKKQTYNFQGHAGHYFGTFLPESTTFTLTGNAGDNLARSAKGKIYLQGKAGYQAFQDFQGTAVVQTVGEDSFIDMHQEAMVIITDFVHRTYLNQHKKGQIIINVEANGDRFDNYIEDLEEQEAQQILVELQAAGHNINLESVKTDYKKLKQNKEGILKHFHRQNNEKENLPQMRKAGWEQEAWDVVQSMAKTAKEPRVAMGGTAYAATAAGFNPASQYKEPFAQQTAPTLSPKDTDSFDTTVIIHGHDRDYHYSTPVITEYHLQELRENLQTEQLDMHLALGETYEDKLEKLKDEALRKARQGTITEVGQDPKFPNALILTHKNASEEDALMDSWLVVSAINKHLIANGVENVKLIVETAELIDLHMLSLNIDMGASLINPYLVLDSLPKREQQRRYILGLTSSWIGIIAQSGMAYGTEVIGRYAQQAIGLDQTILQHTQSQGYLSRFSITDMEARIRRNAKNSQQSDLEDHKPSGAQNTDDVHKHMTVEHTTKLKKDIKDLEDIDSDLPTETGSFERLTKLLGDNKLEPNQDIRGAFEFKQTGYNIAIIGGGPAAYRTAEHLAQDDAIARVTIITSNLPGGGPLYEVSPDHPGTKTEVGEAQEIVKAAKGKIKEIFNAKIETEAQFAELAQTHSAIILATGARPRMHSAQARTDSKGQRIEEIISYSKWTNWLNMKWGKDGKLRTPPIPLDKESLIVEGAGNVAGDVLRHIAKAKADPKKFTKEIKENQHQNFEGWEETVLKPLKESKIETLHNAIRTDSIFKTRYDIQVLNELKEVANLQVHTTMTQQQIQQQIQQEINQRKIKLTLLTLAQGKTDQFLTHLQENLTLFKNNPQLQEQIQQALKPDLPANLITQIRQLIQKNITRIENQQETGIKGIYQKAKAKLTRDKQKQTTEITQLAQTLTQHLNPNPNATTQNILKVLEDA